MCWRERERERKRIFTLFYLDEKTLNFHQIQRIKIAVIINPTRGRKCYNLQYDAKFTSIVDL